MSNAYTHKIEVVRFGIYSGTREVMATFNGDAEIFAQLWIRDNATEDSTYRIEHSPN